MTVKIINLKMEKGNRNVALIKKRLPVKVAKVGRKAYYKPLTASYWDYSLLTGSGLNQNRYFLL